MANSSPPSSSAPSPAPEGERVAKVLARAGVCSRRDAERLIAEGRVKLNGRVLDTPAVKVTAKDKLVVEAEDVASTTQTVVEDEAQVFAPIRCR